jgi:predicted RNase H-like nuclease (RuvC/YqgF family)
VGVDFGVTSAFAAVDYDGVLRALESKRNWGQRDFVARIATFAPTIIAGDTRPPAKQVKKTAATFRALLYTPTHSLTLEEKLFLTRDCVAPAPRNAHERDALAAALKAWHSRENQLRKLGAFLKRRGRSAERDAASERVLRGTRMNDV